tara:strand:- start:327 stop:461 length:135 start_codon:yes stop_codon:yes gene_type:complete
MKNSGETRDVSFNQFLENDIRLIDSPLRPSYFMIINFHQKGRPR